MRIINQPNYGSKYDVVYVGNTPNDEDCTQVNPNVDYLPAQKRECEALAGQLTRMYGEPPDGAYFAIMRNLHDFGTYFELVVMFRIEDEQAADYAYQCEDLPDTWDEEAKAFLNQETVG